MLAAASADPGQIQDPRTHVGGMWVAKSTVPPQEPGLVQYTIQTSQEMV